MKKSDLSRERRECLVPVAGASGVFALVPPPPPRKISLSMNTDKLAEAYEELGRLQEVLKHMPNAELVTRTLERREAVESSQIEGTQTQIMELLEYEATQAPGQAGASDALVTLNYVQALEQGLAVLRDYPERSIDEVLIIDLHATLMQRTGHRWKLGEYRNQQNWIGGSKIQDARFVPPPVSELNRCMAEFVAYINDPHDPESALEAGLIQRMAIVHACFETIHPFPDGNGRVGRLLLPLMMAKEGYVPLYTAGYLFAHRRNYYDALSDMQLKGDWVPWMEMLARAVYESAKESRMLAQKMIAVCDEMQRAVAGARSDSLLAALPSALLARPVTSARQLAKNSRRSFPPAKQALDKMERLGYLVSKKIGHEKIYIAHQLIDLLMRK